VVGEGSVEHLIELSTALSLHHDHRQNYQPNKHFGYLIKLVLILARHDWRLVIGGRPNNVECGGWRPSMLILCSGEG
jgi:hypothetical protein